MSGLPEPQVHRIEIDMSVDDAGLLRSPSVPGVKIITVLENALDLSQDSQAVPFPVVAINANSAGMRWMALNLLALSYNAEQLDDPNLHLHLTDFAPNKRGDPAVVVRLLHKQNVSD